MFLHRHDMTYMQGGMMVTVTTRQGRHGCHAIITPVPLHLPEAYTAWYTCICLQ